MKKRLVHEAIGSVAYETGDARSRDSEIRKQHQKFLKLLDQEQQAVGGKFRVKLEVRNYGGVLVPFFSYERKSDVEIRVEESLQKAEKLLEGRKARTLNEGTIPSRVKSEALVILNTARSSLVMLPSLMFLRKKSTDSGKRLQEGHSRKAFEPMILGCSGIMIPIMC